MSKIMLSKKNCAKRNADMVNMHIPSTSASFRALYRTL